MSGRALVELLPGVKERGDVVVIPAVRQLPLPGLLDPAQGKRGIRGALGGKLVNCPPGLDAVRAARQIKDFDLTHGITSI